MKLASYIAQLLKNHNCVIVPDFGGFVANYKSAVIDEYTRKIHPPSKSVLFNPHLVNNDGLLGNYISQQRNIDYPKAISFIEDAVSEWNKDFESGNRIEIGEIGFLYKENGTVHFEQSREINLLLQAYGMKSINFVRFKETAAKFEVKPVEKVVEEKPLIEEKPVVVEEKVEQKPVKIIEIVDETPVKKKEEKVEEVVAEKEKEEATVIALNQKEEIKTVAKKKKKKEEEDVIPIKRNVTKTVLRYAAAVAFVPILFYSYWIPMETDALETSSIQLTDFNPIHEQAQKTYEQRGAEPVFEDMETSQNWEELTENINAQVYNFELSEDFYVSVSLEKKTSDIPNETPVNDSQEETPIVEEHVVSNGNYHVIAGCFSVRSNADNLVKDLKSQGFSATILDKSNGLTRVSAGGYSSRDEANSGLDQLRNTGNSGWILKK